MKATEAPPLEVRDLSISFLRENGLYRHAVRRVSLTVGQGEIVGLMGPSGSGKTTVAMSLLGLLRGSPGAWEGEVLFQGKPLMPPMARYVTRDNLENNPEISGGKIRKREGAFHKAQETLLQNVRGRAIAAVFQEPRAALDPYFSVGEHLLEALRRGETTGGESVIVRKLRFKAIEFLQDVGLDNGEELWSAFPHQLSGGMAQRVMVAMALCANAKLLVADEPSTALDVTTQAKLLELFRQLREKHNLSILLISHDPRVIRETCQRVYVLNQGAVVETFSPNEALVGSSSSSLYSLKTYSLKPSDPVVPFQVVRESATPLLEVRDLRKIFQRDRKSFLALGGVSLALQAGETYALVGESGSGKSTLALSILALQKVDGGKILYKGEDLSGMGGLRMREMRREVRMLFQHPESVLNSGMTVFAILAEGLEKDGKFPRSEIKERIAEVLEQVHLGPEYARRYPGNLSSGEKQRVAIARALITQPKLLICDEPVASLDLAVQSHILELLRELRGKSGLTYLFISHNLEWIKGMAGRVGTMSHGKIVEELPIGDFTLKRAQHPDTRSLLVSSLDR